jgi:hypothetical protein
MPFVRIAWGKLVKVEEIKYDPESDDVDWDNAVIVYGIIGILELFSGTYLVLDLSFARLINVMKRLISSSSPLRRRLEMVCSFYVK